MLMLKGRAKAFLHGIRHFGDSKHRIVRIMKDVTLRQELLSAGTAGDIAVLCECGEVFEQHLPPELQYLFT